MVELPVRRDGTVVDWAQPIRAAWDISERGALAIMEQFLAEGAPCAALPQGDNINPLAIMEQFLAEGAPCTAQRFP